MEQDGSNGTRHAGGGEQTLTRNKVFTLGRSDEDVEVLQAVQEVLCVSTTEKRAYDDLR